MYTTNDLYNIIAEDKEDFKPRDGQAALSDFVLSIINNHGSLLCEAPTGFGKSFAVIIPAILAAVEENRRTVITTETLALQDQYVNKDLPILQEACRKRNIFFSYAVAKGRGNYICRQKVDEFDYVGQTELMAWASSQHIERDTGDMATVPFAFNASEWHSVCADEDCERSACPYYMGGRKGPSDCFVYEAQRRFLQSKIVVTNHTMVLLDIEQEAGSILGQYDSLIVDEAHSFAEKAQSCWGTSIKPHTISRTISLIHRMLGKVDVRIFEQGFIDAWRDAENKMFAPFAPLIGKNVALKQVDSRIIDTSKVHSQAIVQILKTLNRELSDQITQSEDSPQTVVIRSCKEKLTKLTADLGSIFGDNLDPTWSDNWLAFLETGYNARREPHVILNLKPIEVAPLMHAMLFNEIPASVFMSATLRIGSSFGFVRRELGVPQEALEFIGESPFDFEKNTLGYFPTHLPDPSSDDYLPRLAEAILETVNYSKGRALILFTNLNHMRYCRDYVAQRVNYPCFMQGEAAKPALVNWFNANVHSCLFASRSFFSGIDLPGETCSCVIMTKAPFEVPTEPMFKARCDKIDDEGGSSFNTLSMPAMLFQVRQAHGRLIRNVTDKGIFAFLDSRAMRKSYGKRIIQSLPSMPKVNRLGGQETASVGAKSKRQVIDNFDE